MRNLKRALSLLLAAAMLIGMMVVGASAASSLDDFPDKDEIVNQDAVSLLTILGVIEGTDSGTFNPTGNVTRAEMAKMIATILNQGADVAGLYTGMNTGLTDVSGHWAESYINYCYSLGIIAGRGDGTFDPGADVTGTEAAKMLLVAAGYDPGIEGMEGSDWAIRTAALASTLGIFDNLTAPTGDPLNRDNAALLVYNALDVEMIQSYNNGYPIVFSDYRTLLSNRYGVYRMEGVVIGNEWARLEGTDSASALAEGKTRLANIRLVDSDTQNTSSGVDDGTLLAVAETLNVSTPVEYLGQTVTMYVRNTTVLANSEVLGVYLKDGANTLLTTAESEDDMTDYLRGTGLSIDGNTEYYVNYGDVGSEAAAQEALSFNSGDRFTSVAGNTNAYGVEMTVIDNDEDGMVDYVLWLQETLTQVTVRNDSDETTVFNGINRNNTIDNEDIVSEAAMDEGDLVLLVSYGGRYYVSDPEVITGEMEAYQASQTREQTITVNGTEYNPSYIVYEAHTADNTYEFNIRDCDDGLDGVQFDTTYNFILDSNGNVIAYQPSEQGLYDYALILESGYEPGAFASDASGKVTALLPDGTESTYTLNFSASAKNIGEQIYGDDATTNQGIAELKGFLGTSDSDNSSTAPWTPQSAGAVFAVAAGEPALTQAHFPDGMGVGYVVGYSLNDDNVMTITEIVGSTVDDDPEVSEYSNTGATASGGKDVVDSRLSSDYATGAGRIRYNSDRDQLTIDRNTVAFYYVNDDTYGVAVGYDEMADVDTRTPFVAKTVRETNLAAVVLFEAEGVEAERSYVYVMDYNNRTSTIAELDVVYEDGTVGVMTISRDNFDDVLDADSKFGCVYAYTTNGDLSELDDSDLNDTVKYGNLWRLRDGSLALYDENNGRFIDSYSYDDTRVWNVENLSTALTTAPAASFTINVAKEAVLVLDTTGDKVKAAFVERTLTNAEQPGIDAGDLELPEPYVTLYNPTVTAIVNAFNDENSVYIPGNFAPAAGTISIPDGMGLQVGGNLDLTGVTLNNYGMLIVDGTLTTSAATSVLSGDVQAEDLALGVNTTISGSVTVNNDVTGAHTLGIADNATMYVGGDLTSTTTVAGELNVEGAANNVTVSTGGHAVVDGNVVAAATTGGALEIGGNVTGSVALSGGGSIDVTGNVNGTLTQGGGSLDVTGSLTTSGPVVADANNDLSVGGTLNTANNTVTVSGSKTMTVGGNLITGSGTITVNDGTLNVTGNVTTTAAVAVNDGEMTAGTLDAGSSTITVGTTSTAGSLTVNGDTTATGGVDVLNGDMTVNNGDLDNGANEIVVGDNDGREGTLIVDGDILGTASVDLRLRGGSAEVGDVATVSANAGTELTVLGNVTTINANAGTIDVTGNVTTITNNGANGVITVSGTITTITANSGTINANVVTNALPVALGGTLNLSGSATVTGTTTGSAVVHLNSSDAVLSVSGDVSSFTITGVDGAILRATAATTVRANTVWDDATSSVATSLGAGDHGWGKASDGNEYFIYPAP